ncbi:hypothetical protein MMC26_000709 [Xylographa opegraphella]|nr:hypothetical protein [Xylographa opegraphella]
MQRLKGAIDSRIAEEQARQRNAQQLPARSNSVARRPSSRSRTSSPAVRSARARPGDSKTGDIPEKGPDPKEFEPEFVIEDEDVISRAGTPRPVHVKDGESQSGEAVAEKSAAPDGERQPEEDRGSEKVSQVAALELPSEVRVKLRKLERLESRYQELLRSYRIAHARVTAIEPFENTLRENTPLTSINDPSAFVEYLNQLNLKGDMVLDELKRVTTERATFKQKLDEAEKRAREAWDEVTKLRSEKVVNTNGDQDQVSLASAETSGFSESITQENSTTKTEDSAQPSVTSPSSSAKSRTPSLRGMSLFSPRTKSAEIFKPTTESEEFFSYDNELPRLESESKEQQDKISKLESEITGLKGDLGVARESAQNMVQTLEESTLELNVLREQKDRYEIELAEQRSTSEEVKKKLEFDLEACHGKIRQLELQISEGSKNLAEQEKLVEQTKIELEKTQASDVENANAAAKTTKLQKTELDALQTQLIATQLDKDQEVKCINTLNGLVTTLREKLAIADQDYQRLKSRFDDNSKSPNHLEAPPEDLEVPSEDLVGTRESITAEVRPNGESISAKKKNKNKKKKKTNKSTNEKETQLTVDESLLISEQATDGVSTSDGFSGVNDAKLQESVSNLRILVAQKDAAIDRLCTRLKGEEAWQEEIDTLRDCLVNIGQEHVLDKDKIQKLISEKSVLENKILDLEQQVSNVHALQQSEAAGKEAERKDLTAQFDDLKIKAADLQTDLSVAQQLASSRFKDLSDLRTILQKAQPELAALRNENGELKLVKAELAAKVTELQQIEVRHNSMRGEMSDMKKSMSDKEAQMKRLDQRLDEESSGRVKAETAYSKTCEELKQCNGERQSLTQSLEKVSKDLGRAHEEVGSLKSQVRELEATIRGLERDNEGLKDDIELKTAQHASAESLMSSMRDQTSEMAVQTREARERCESLEEELADAHRLLSERSREGETMRRLLGEVEGRADSRIREMKERMDTAIEERDRAEDEASTAGRRRVRELEEIRNKLREAERNLSRAEEAKEELEIAQRDWKKRREELEQQFEQSVRESEDVKRAMNELREALDKSERQAHDMENQKVELHHSVEEAQLRLDRLQKSNKTMSDELRSLQATKSRPLDSLVQSPRSSIDTPPSRSMVSSPTSKNRTSSTALHDSHNPQPVTIMDYVYLKNVLLQFLEQKDKKHQMQLIPVLGMLLHFDRKDEQKWMAAVTAK